ncbi:MAG: hypothetical protein ACRCYX_03135 [Dermatophilaceae bacterium]
MTVPVLLWTVFAFFAGTDAPLVSTGLAVAVFPFLVVPVFAPDLLGRRRGRVVADAGRKEVVFPATEADRYATGTFSLLAIAAPQIARWDAARVGGEVSTQIQFQLWLLPAFGVAGLVWAVRRRPTRLTLHRGGIVAQTHQHDVVLDWDDIPALTGQKPPRLDSALLESGLRFGVYQLASDPETVTDVIEFYRTHPGLRREIGSDDFWARLERGDLAPAPAPDDDTSPAPPP